MADPTVAPQTPEGFPQNAAAFFQPFSSASHVTSTRKYALLESLDPTLLGLSTWEAPSFRGLKLG